MAWHIAEIVGVVTGDAHHPGRPHTARAPHHQRLMQRASLTLERTVGAGMAVDATRVLEDLADFGEQRPGALRVVSDIGKGGERLQGSGWGR